MNYEKIGIFIATKRKEKNLTQKQLAQKIGVTDKAVSKWERGLGCPDVSILELLSKELSVSILEILKGRIIENEVIPVTELNDYVLDTVKYTKHNTKIKLKKIIENIITILIIGICSFLFIANVSHIIYLNKYEMYNNNNNNQIDEIKENIKKINQNIEIISNNQGKYKLEDYKKINDCLHETQLQFNKIELLKFDFSKKIYLNDLYIFDLTTPKHFCMLNNYDTLENYDATMKEYGDLYKYSYLTKIYSNSSLIDNTYKYEIVDIFGQGNQVLSNIKVTSRILNNLYYTKELLFFTENVIKVGEINE